LTISGFPANRTDMPRKARIDAPGSAAPFLCQEDPYLKELVRYIHLNPLRAKLVADYKSLNEFRYAGHRGLMGKCPQQWQNTEYILNQFGLKVSAALRLYSKFVEKGIGEGQRPELVGGGLIRSLGGWVAAKAARGGQDRINGDERILGGGDFVEEVLGSCRQQLEKRYQYLARGYDFDWLAGKVADLLGLEPEVVTRHGRYPDTVQARSALCYWAARDLGISTLEPAKRLGVSQPTASQSVKRGEKIIKEMGLKLMG
jgi:putative transposase